MVTERSRAMPATPQEQGDIEMLNAMMGGSLDSSVALNILRKYNGNLDKAASALLEGDTAEDDSTFADLPRLEPLDAPMLAQGPRTPPPSRPENSIIDLTKEDDEELARALRASLQDHQGPQFGPSERAPDPNWAMVPSNVEVNAPTGMSQDDQAMSRAIEASLSSTMGEDTYHELPLVDRIRVGDTPVALRPTLPSVAYAALLLHGLFFVPQFRHTIARWLPHTSSDELDIDLPRTGPAHQVYTAVEILCNMDYARLSELNVDEALNAFSADSWNSPTERPGDLSARFYEKFAYAVDNVLQYNNLHNPERRPSRLMALTYGNHDAELDDPNTDSLCYLKVSLGASPELNDLVSLLAAELAPPETSRLKAVTKRQVIFEPSEVIAFQLVRDAAPPSYDATIGRRTERETFKYPKSVYLDQFMRESYELASQKRAEQRKLLEDVKALEERKQKLLYFDDKDTMASLESALYYYENIAESDGDSKRAAQIHKNKEKFARIIEKLKEDVKELDATIERTRTEAQGLLECSELQKHRYDLRAVFVHDGLYGRNHLYSYIKQKGKWWKTVDYTVTEVPEETVLSDATGLHLGAGPYFLIYSRAVSQEEEDARAEWPENVKDNVKYNNRLFFEQIPPEVAARVVDPNSAPSSPAMAPTPSEFTISSDVAEPPESRDEFMDTE